MGLPFPSSRRGFTLVEIMVVEVIIGLLAALARPAFPRVKRSAVSKRDLNEAREVRDGAERSALENGGVPPDGIGGPHPSRRSVGLGLPAGRVHGLGLGRCSYGVGRATAGHRPFDRRRRSDDGDLTPGLLRKTGSKAGFIIEL